MASLIDYVIPGVSVLSGWLGSEASEDAANSQRMGNAAAIESQNAQYRQTRADLAPWRNVGSQAQNRLALMLGLDPYAGPTGARTVSVPQAQFDPAAYLAANPDVAASQHWSQIPWEHWVQTGQAEGRNSGVSPETFNALLAAQTAGQPRPQDSPYWMTGIRTGGLQGNNALRSQLIGG